jgi:hypothetical protein
MNFGLVKFLMKELLRKRKSAELVKFLYDIIKQYLKLNLQLYNDILLILDPEYQKQKKNYDKYQQYKKDIANAYKLIKYMMKESGSRDKMKQIRRDFEKYGRLPTEFEQELLKEIYGR